MNSLCRLFLIALIVKEIYSQTPCAQKQERFGIVCVCNSTYCDDFPPLDPIENGEMSVHTTSNSGQRFNKTILKFGTSKQDSSDLTLTINASKTYQTIVGFGGAMSDSAAYNILKLPKPAQQKLMSSYFGPNGIGYTMSRVSMGAADYSPKLYNYDEHAGDFDLKNFSLQDVDYEYKIPVLKMAQDLIGDKLKLYSSTWSSPAWMKQEHSMIGCNFSHSGCAMLGDVNGDFNASAYYRTYAKYFVRFFEEYAKQNITFWGFTIQNEPLMTWPNVAMWVTAEVERDFLKKFLGPAIRENPITKDLNIMIYDYDRAAYDKQFGNYSAVEYVNIVLKDIDAASFTNGIAMHCYQDDIINYTTLENLHANHDKYWILNTENLNHWSTGWVDWDIVIDPAGGPTVFGFGYVDSPIIVDDDNLTFYKQPMFYAMGHFSKFVPENSVRIDLNWSAEPQGVDGIAFSTPEGHNILILMNNNSQSYQIAIKDVGQPNKVVDAVLEPYSIVTYRWNALQKTCSCPFGNWYPSALNPCNCYSFISTQTTWDLANQECQNRDARATLTSIDSAFENQGILATGKNLTLCEQYFIGYQAGDNGSWRWINNDTSGYVNWRSGYPNMNPNDKCSQLNTKDGKWTNTDCTTSIGCFVCKITNTLS